MAAFMLPDITLQTRTTQTRTMGAGEGGAHSAQERR
jgi:hypothetical protein